MTPYSFALTFKIAQVFEPKDLGENAYDHPDYDDQEEKKRDFFKSATLGRVTLKDGTQHWVGRFNFKGGQCDCCGYFYSTEIIKYERLELIEE